MVNIMTGLKLYALLTVFDLIGLLVTIRGGILPQVVEWVLIVLVAIPVYEMMRLASGLLFRELMPGN